MRYDEFQHELMNNPIYSAREYDVFVSRDGEKRVLVGVHSLCDGRYHKWKILICGAKHAVDADLKVFLGLCESVRKDGE